MSVARRPPVPAAPLWFLGFDVAAGAARFYQPRSCLSISHNPVRNNPPVSWLRPNFGINAAACYTSRLA
jgi:hypothetical protein